MEFGEAIAFGKKEPEGHDESVCPWHEKSEPKGGPPLTEASPPERAPANSSSKLRDALEADGSVRPEGHTVQVAFASVPAVPGGVVTYVRSEDPFPYPVEYSAHHLIPGNESLKGHRVLRWMADDNKMGSFKTADVTSELLSGQSIGYDVNAAANGAWLPAPYALGRSRGWARKELNASGVDDFKRAYTHAVMNWWGRQLHGYRHADYSTFVSKQLTKIDARAGKDALLCGATATAKDGTKKYLAPLGLVARLDGVSGRLRLYVFGKRWHAAIYTDDGHGKDYVRERAARRGRP